MKICELLKEEFIIPQLNSRDKIGVINELIDLFRDSDLVLNLELFRKAVIDREKIMSTGVGKGFAVPHAKTNAVKDIIIAFGKTSDPVDFESLDGKPVELVILLAAKEKMVAPHIRLLSRISRMMNDDSFRSALKGTDDTKEILELFCKEEKKFESI